MPSFLIVMWTGPCTVEAVAAALRQHDPRAWAGTETAYFHVRARDCDDAEHQAREVVRGIYPHAGYRPHCAGWDEQPESIDVNPEKAAYNPQ